jgi:hypothetical protein
MTTRALILAITLLLAGTATAAAQATGGRSGIIPCSQWQRRVDPRLMDPKSSTARSTTPSDSLDLLRRTESPSDSRALVRSPHSQDNASVVHGIRCLLKLEGRTDPALVYGATRFDTSQFFDSASVQVAALYYISYLFYDDWGHGGAVVLVDRSHGWNTDRSVHRAFASYRKSYRLLRKIGVDEMRRRKIDPLDNTGLRWY